MLAEKKAAGSFLFLIFLFSLGLSAALNLNALQGNFLFADEAIYFSLTQSLAQDFDLEYTKKDLYRYYKVFDSGPMGIFLKKGKGDRIFYAKSFAYPLFAAPFVRVFGTNGFLVFHSLLLLLVLFLGVAYFSLGNRLDVSLLVVLTFIFASVAPVYFLWISPDFFNLTLVFCLLFLWLYKYRFQEQAQKPEKIGRLQKFLLSDGSDYLASGLAGIAVFTKPPNLVLLGPLVFYTLAKKRSVKALLMAFIFLAASGLFWGTNYLATGDWNYQGGERKTFYHNYPLEKESVTFDSIGGEMTAEDYGAKHLLPAKFIFFNLFYYFFGRFTGVAWYFFPAFLALVLFFSRKRSFEQWLLLAALAVQILIYIILMPDNYAGGGGALGNRYFLNIYPLFLFLPGLKRNTWEVGLSWVAASLFIAQILISPLRHSHFPATHVKKFPFKVLPIEMTLVNNFPTNTNPEAFRKEVGSPPDIGWLHFLDDNFLPKQEPNGFWTRGPHQAEMILKTWFPVEELRFHLLNNPRLSNEITVKVAGQKKKITLGTNQRGTLSFFPQKVFRMKYNHLYQIKVKAEKAAIPYFEDEKSREKRYLGVFFELKIIPKK